MIMNSSHVPFVRVGPHMARWRLVWRTAAATMVVGMSVCACLNAPMLMLACGLLGTAVVWLALMQLEKPAKPAPIKEKYDHWQAELQQVQAELKLRNFWPTNTKQTWRKCAKNCKPRPDPLSPLCHPRWHR